MSKTLFVKNIKSHWKLLVAFLALLTMYMAIIISMYDPADADLMRRLAGLNFSQNLLAAFGFETIDPSLTGFIATYLYGFLMPGLPMLYTVIMGNKLVASLVDKGSMAGILMGPVTRRRVATTQMVYLVLTLMVMVAYVTVLGLVISVQRFPGLLNVPAFLRMNVGLLALHLALAGISFFFSCLFNQTGASLALGAGIPTVFLLLRMLLNSSPRLKTFRYATIFSLYNAAEIALGKPWLLPTGALLVIAVALFVGGVLVFNRKDLPL